MKNILTLLIILFLIGCQEKEILEPQTLEEYNEVLVEKKSELKELEAEIAELTDKIAELDPSLQEKAKLVDTTLVKSGSFVRHITIQGIIEADDPVNAVSEIAGRITRLNVKEGSYIKKGQVVAILDVDAIQKQIDEINTSLDLAQDIYERQERLWKQNIGSEIQYLQAKNNVERLEKSLATINLQFSKNKVYAPISGTVEMLMTKQGEVTAPGQPIVQILSTSNLVVSTDLPENYLKIIRRGQTVELNFPSIDVQTNGTISLLGSSIDPTNRTLELEIRPSMRHSLFKPNMLAEIKIVELEKNEVITMPVEFVLQEVDGTEFVYISELDDENKFRARKKYIALGETAEGTAVIDNGLNPGDAVIFRGARNVSEGELLEFSK